MAVGWQQANVAAMSDLTGLTHDIFVGDVKDLVIRESPTASIFMEAEAGTDYRLEGQNTVFAVDTDFVNGALATSGVTPAHVDMDAVQGKVNPTRRYAGLAVDNYVEAKASGPGAFENFAERLFKQMWSKWKSMEVRQSINASTGYVCKAGSRTSSTVFVAKDGYGHVGTNPTQHLSPGTFLAWYDVSAAGWGGAGQIATGGVNHTTFAITMDSAATWEPSAQLAAGDYIVMSTCGNITDTSFGTEKDLSPNGVGTILDPDAALTTAFNISQTTSPRWKPYRQASATFDHMELTEHWAALGAKRGFQVNPNDDVVISFGAPLRQLARSLMGFQQQAYTGEKLIGGYTGVQISGMGFVEDTFFYHDVCATLHRPALKRLNIGGDADFFTEDGSQWQRIIGYDGKEAFVKDYMNYLCDHRGANGALTGIVTPDITSSQFTNTPNY